MSSNFRVPPVPPSDEIDIAALFDSVWRQRWLIAGIAVSTFFLAAAYAFLAKPVYHVSSILRPAAINELDALNRSEVYQLPPAAALVRVGASLESYETRLGFFRANQNLFQAFVQPGRTLEQSFEEFNRNSINLKLPDPKQTDLLSSYIRLDMDYDQGVDGVAILNGFINYAIALEREQVAGDMRVIIKNRLNELSGKLDAARSSYESEKGGKIALLRESDELRRSQLQDELKALRTQLKTLRSDRIAQLDEAIAIAKVLNIKKPTTPSSLGDSDRPGTSSVMRTEINNQQIPLYFMGVEALEAERVALRKRTSDDFTEGRIAQIARELQLLKANREVEILNQRKNEDIFLSGVQPLRAEQARLRNLNIDMSRLSLVTIDKKALEPLGPIKPKKIMILILGAFFGLILGLTVALLRHPFRARSVDNMTSPYAVLGASRVASIPGTNEQR
ncbi:MULTISPECIES: Wzz/FepE/Etk N-terminal domain-containing protein [unclassified Pseudomonas]|uniref:Wzz/FepE/Etk N-terminal domain-containing protein n=1 Tax=unclassified Pseudomonas TaxID=196821 RepID=UPI00159F8909|nr:MULTISPECIES: Wzz/FepE/Etk N-terminal domain-containing protein [unclassified Pseudomonas]NWC95255.1 chain-length determining protein [Pseudomonas sp. IPO3779]NWD17145.1 chain-length determining protein [Pseudomonas sp. IPO3778]